MVTDTRPREDIASRTSTIQDPSIFSSTNPLDVEDSDVSEDQSDFEMPEHFRADGSTNIPEDTFSLTDSVLEHITVLGRQYHAKSAGKYYLPTDEAEQNRLDKAHHLQLSRLSGSLYLAPIPRDSDPAYVLDCGTGTGIWALDFGELHPRSEVIGVDLAPIQPTWTYKNVVFEVDDLEEDWTFPSNHFNFIHTRGLGLAIKDWQRYTEQIHTAPGGYVEISESELSATLSSTTDDPSCIPPSSPISEYLTTVERAYERAGIPVKDFSGGFFESHLRAAGFVDVEVYTFAIPWGSWVEEGDCEVVEGKGSADMEKMKKIGEAAVEVVGGGCEAVGLAIMNQVLEMNEMKAKSICREAEKAIRKGEEKRYHWHWQVVARKPGKK